MFERYTEPARRSIFFARAIALIDKAPRIDSTHLLRGVMWQDTCRAQVLFRLSAKLPQYPQPPRYLPRSKDLNLTDEGKRILVFAIMEADAMGDAWVDTDHLLLGILREPDCEAARQLIAAGLTQENARAVVVENRSSRPDYGPVIPPGTSRSPRVWMISEWRSWKARLSEKRFAAKRRP